jgi:hypothetical protein
LLLLLHLLQIQVRNHRIRRLLSAFHQHAPILWNGQFAVESRGVKARFDLDGDIEFAFGFAAEDAMSGGTSA